MGGSVLAVSGTLTNSGSIAVGNTNISFEPPSITASAMINSGTITLIGANESSPIAALTASQAIQNSGSLLLSRGAAVFTLGTFSNLGSVTLDVANPSGGSLLSVGGSLNNAKTIQIGDATDTYNQPTDFADSATANTLSNQQGAVLDVYDGGSLTVSGNVTNAGIIALDKNNSYNTGNVSIGATLTNSGSVQIGDAQSAGNDMATVGSLNNAGTLTLIGYSGTSYDASLVVTGSASNSGIIALSAEAQINIAGSLYNTGSIALDASSSIGGAALIVGGTLTNYKTITVGNPTNTNFESDRLTLGGLVNVQGATIILVGSAPLSTTMTVTGATTDTGSIVASNSRLVMKGAVGGTGTIALIGGDTLELGGTDSAAITLTGSNNLIKLDTPSARVTGTISGLALGDVIDLGGVVATGASFNAARTLITVTTSNLQTITYSVAGISSAAGIEFKSDGSGGTDLSVVPQFNWANAVSGTWTTAGDWTPVGLPALGDIVEIGATGAPYTVTSSANAGADVLGLAAGATLAIASGTTFTLGAALTNAGTIAVQAAGKSTTLNIAAGIPVKLTGGGRITLSNDAGNLIGSTVTGTLLDNVDNVISGAGTINILSGNETAGIINANGSTALNVIGTIVNSGLMEATGTGGLSLSGSVTGTGKLLAAGANAHIDLVGATISGGTLATANGGVINVTGPYIVLPTELSGATAPLNITGSVEVTASGYLGLLGAINNSGSIAVAAGGEIAMGGPSTLSGGGAVTVAAKGFLSAAGLDNVNDTIIDAGTFDSSAKIRGSTTFTNEAAGVINVSSGTAYAFMNNFTNHGLIEDTGTGGIELQDAVNNIGGTIEAVGSGTHIDLSIADIVGGTLNTLSGGVIQTTGPDNELDGSTAVVTNLGNLQFSYGTAIAGTINNAGTITVNRVDLDLLYGQTARLTGSGLVAMTAGSRIVEVGSLDGTAITTLDNVGNTISGTTAFYDKLINEAAATINATGLMTFNGSSVNVTNAGLMEATGNGELSFQGDVVTNTGVIAAIGPNAEISMTNVTLAGGTVRTTGGATIATGSSFYLDGTSAGAITLDITQMLSAYSLAGSLSFVNDGGLSFVSPQSTPRTAISLGTGQSLLKSGGSGISQVAMNGNILSNSGTVGSASGTLLIANGTIKGSGTIAASGAGSVSLYQDDLQGGTLKSSGTGTFIVSGASTWDGSTSAGAVNNQAYVSLSQSSSLFLFGTINNTGTIIASSSVTLSPAPVTLTGGGLLTMVNANINAPVVGTMLSTSDTIFEENGVIGAGMGTDLQNTGTLNLLAGTLWLDHLFDPTHSFALPQSVNSGTIEAVGGSTSVIESAPIQSGQFDFPDSDLTNTGILEAGASSTLTLGVGIILTNFSSTVAGDLIGGTWEANGSNARLILTGGVVIDAATLILSGSGSEIEGSGSNATLETTLTTIAAGGALELLGSRGYATGNAITLAASVNGAAGGILQLGGGEFYSSTLSAGVGSMLTGFGVVASQSGTDSGTVNAVGGTLEFNGVTMTFSGAIGGSGTVTFDGESSILLNSGATLSVAALTASGGASLEIAESVSYGGVFTEAAGEAVTIDPGYTFTLTGKSTIAGTIGGGALALAGGGSTLLQSGGGFLSNSVSLSGTGTSLEVAETAAVSQGSFNEGSGTSITVDAGDTFSVTATTTLAGTVAGAGTLALGGATSNVLASGALLSVANLALADTAALEVAATTTYAGSFTSASGTQVTVDAGDSFTLAGKATIGGSMIAGAGASMLLKGAVTITGTLNAEGAGSTVSLAPSAQLSNNVNGTLTGGEFDADKGGIMSLTGGIITTDAASIDLGGSGSVIQSGTGTSFTSIQQSLKTIAAGGSLTISGGAYTFANAIALNGTLSVFTPPISGYSPGSFTSGLITASAGSMIQSSYGNGTIASSLNDAGTVSVNGFASLTFTGAQDTFSGTFKSSLSLIGNIYFAAGTDTFAAGASFTNASTQFDGATVKLAASINDSGNFAMSSGTLVLSTSSSANVFTIAKTANLSGGTLSGLGSLTLDGTTNLGAFAVSGGATMTNAGSLTDTGTLTLGGAGGLHGTIVNMAGDSYSFTGAGAGIAAAAGGTGSITNAGTLVGASVGTSSIGVGIANSGVISATSGTLDLQGAVTGTGTLSVQGASTLEFDAAVASTEAFVFSDNLGTLLMKNSSAFGASIAGFAAGDTLDFGDFTTAGTNFVYTPSSASAVGGVLSVTNGTHAATLTLTGSSYAATGFSLTSDGHGGTDLVYTAPTQHLAHA